MKKVIIGLLFGFAFGFLLKFFLKQPPKGPSSRKVKKTTYYDKKSDQHYRFHPVTHICPPSINVDDFEHSDDESSSSTL